MKGFIFLITSSLFINFSYQSECVVSEWGSWSRCFGGCRDGLIVRNRDVLQPPLPELTFEGKMMQRLCPHLYETKYCTKSDCAPTQVPLTNVMEKKEEKNFTASAQSLVEEQMAKVGFEPENDPVQMKLKQKFVSETEQLLKLDEILARQLGSATFDASSLPLSHNTSIDMTSYRIPTKSKSQQFVNDDQNKEENLEQLENMREISASTPKTLSSPGNAIDITNYPITYRKTSNTRRLKPSLDYSINSLLKNIENALDYNQPLDERYIKNAIRQNRKLSKILIEAYRNKKQNAFNENMSTTTTTTPEVLTTEEVKTTPVTTPMLYWPKKGYVPNTRKHAAEITSQLYVTNEIQQTLADDQPAEEINPDCKINKRCCKITKENCNDGTKPVTVKRWYRPPGSSQCVAYHYPRCSSTEEMNELPILFEQNCQDICFSKDEKKISPLFKLEFDDV